MPRKIVFYNLATYFSLKTSKKEALLVVFNLQKIWGLQLSPYYKLTFVTKFKTGFIEITCGSLSEGPTEESSLG